MPDDEKRGYTRYPIWFPVTVQAEAGEVWAVSRDASPGGILLSGATSLQIGSRVTVTFRIRADDTTEHNVAGTVVRMAPNVDDDPRGVWPHRMAIEFNEPLPEIELPLKRASERPPAGAPPSSRK
jgi:hypothetical protein